MEGGGVCFWVTSARGSALGHTISPPIDLFVIRICQFRTWPGVCTRGGEQMKGCLETELPQAHTCLHSLQSDKSVGWSYLQRNSWAEGLHMWPREMLTFRSQEAFHEISEVRDRFAWEGELSFNMCCGYQTMGSPAVTLESAASSSLERVCLLIVRGWLKSQIPQGGQRNDEQTLKQNIWSIILEEQDIYTDWPTGCVRGTWQRRKVDSAGGTKLRAPRSSFPACVVKSGVQIHVLYKMCLLINVHFICSRLMPLSFPKHSYMSFSCDRWKNWGSERTNTGEMHGLYLNRNGIWSQVDLSYTPQPFFAQSWAHDLSSLHPVSAHGPYEVMEICIVFFTFSCQERLKSLNNVPELIQLPRGQSRDT